MKGHIDLVTDVGQTGVRTVAARRHLETCAECRRDVTAVQRLVQLAAPALRAEHTRAGQCLSLDEIVDLARSPDTRTNAHVNACDDCRAAVEEARAALSPSLVRLKRVPPLPAHLRERIQVMRPALPMAAIPRDITRPSTSRETTRAPRRPARTKARASQVKRGQRRTRKKR